MLSHLKRWLCLVTRSLISQYLTLESIDLLSVIQTTDEAGPSMFMADGAVDSHGHSPTSAAVRDGSSTNSTPSLLFRARTRQARACSWRTVRWTVTDTSPSTPIPQSNQCCSEGWELHSANSTHSLLFRARLSSLFAGTVTSECCITTVHCSLFTVHCSLTGAGV